MSQAMKTTARRTLILLLALPLVGCGYWQGQPGNIRDVLADPELEHIRLTHTDGSRTEARLAELQGDTIYGTRGGSGGLTCYEAAPSCSLRVSIEEIGFVERRRFSLIKSLAMVLVPIGFVFAVGAN
jgi:hypothetical protein